MPASNSEEVDIAAEQEAETATTTKKKNEPPKKKTQFELMALLNPPKKKEKPKKEEPLERNINHVRMEEAAAAGKSAHAHAFFVTYCTDDDFGIHADRVCCSECGRKWIARRKCDGG